MDFRQEKRGFSKLEYFLILVLVVTLGWAAWIMLEPIVRPVIEQFLQVVFQEAAVTPTPIPGP